MNRHERRWFMMMLARRKPILIAAFLPYWMIRTPIFMLALILRHAAKKHADRFKS